MTTGVALLLAAASTKMTMVEALESKKEDWYKKYESYPPYCSTPEAMDRRAIPALENSANDPRLGETRLVQVTALIRHGARTPWKGGLDCWEGYETSSDTGVWDCDLTTILAPPSPKRIKEEEGSQKLHPHNNDATDAMFLFEKKYDALEEPLHNQLNGTCQVGQLLLQGYEQQMTNGKHLRSAYMYRGGGMEHDIRMRLLDLTNANYLPWEDPYLYYRSDDDQRTLMSGQVLLRGMFGPELLKHWSDGHFYPSIPVHTADRMNDVLDANERMCPRLTELRDKAEQSQEFQVFNTSEEAELLRTFMQNEFGAVLQKGATIDCLMTTMCTDRDLPDAINDYGRNTSDDSSNGLVAGGRFGSNLFDRLIAFGIQKYSIPLRYNDAEYAKLGLAPLWAEILDIILPVINSDNTQTSPPRTKLAVFSGHDTTIMPILASLGPGVWDGTDWPPYASMLLLEIHELIDGDSDKSIFPSKFAFRLLYNGQILTSRMDGCSDSELCDISILLKRVQPFATRDVACEPLSDQGEPVALGEDIVIASPAGILMLITVTTIGAMLGALASFVALTGRWPCNRGKPIISESGRLALRRGTSGPMYRDAPANGNGDGVTIRSAVLS